MGRSGELGRRRQAGERQELAPGRSACARQMAYVPIKEFTLCFMQRRDSWCFAINSGVSLGNGFEGPQRVEVRRFLPQSKWEMKAWFKVVGELTPPFHLTSPSRNEPLLLLLSGLCTDLYHSTPLVEVFFNTSVFYPPPDCSSGKAAARIPSIPSIQYPFTSYSASQTFIRMQIWVSRSWVEVRICISSKLPVACQQGLST